MAATEEMCSTLCASLMSLGKVVMGDKGEEIIVTCYDLQWLRHHQLVASELVHSNPGEDRRESRLPTCLGL